MGKVIDSTNLESHKVRKFQFASFPTGEDKQASFDKKLFSEGVQETDTKGLEPEKESTSPDIDELLQKIESLSSANVNLEMELETLKKEFDEKVNSSSEHAYEKGKEEGIKEAQDTLQDHSDVLNTQLVKSITNLDEQLQQHQAFLSAIEDELIDASIIIAKKIIKVELHENSQRVAEKLSEVFINDLKDASDITLKVNPKDAHHIEELYCERKNVKIDPDDAINKGGIIILTDIGNIDGNIETRLEKAIALIEREG